LDRYQKKSPVERNEERGIAHQIADLVERRQGEHFERWRVAELLSDRICESPQNLDDETIDRFSRLFDEINRLI